ncbi:MAG: hypothetical protein RLZZ400_20 [Actinomycetota bacterium]
MENREEIRLANIAPSIIEAMDRMKDSYGSFEVHPSQQVDPAKVEEVLGRLTDRLQDNFPYFHPRYAGQMLKPGHPVAMAAYIATMMLNPNNQSIDGGRATTYLEREVILELAKMFGYPEGHLGHLTWSGTTANLEALWVGREINPNGAIAHSADAHYTHNRMGEVLNVKTISIETDERGRMRLDHLEEVLKTGEVGTVVATVGTTGLGAVDPLADIIPLARQYGARVHVDTAYGGFFRLISDHHLETETARHYAAIADSDSVVVDPHKHGLQPYGCGAVLFRDVSVGRFYKHDSPYTYFASKDLHYGEIQLECSRAGASAAALWATLQIFPLSEDGLGQVILGARRAATTWYELLESSDSLMPLQRPELDILGYLPRIDSMSKLDAASQAIFEQCANRPREEQVHVATYMLKEEGFKKRGITVNADAASAKILRSVLMKPEHEYWVDGLHKQIEQQAREIIGAN